MEIQLDTREEYLLTKSSKQKSKLSEKRLFSDDDFIRYTYLGSSGFEGKSIDKMTWLRTPLLLHFYNTIPSKSNICQYKYYNNCTKTNKICFLLL